MHRKASTVDQRSDIEADQREAAFREAIAALHSYRRLPADWDTYGGTPAHEKPVAFGVRLLEALSRIPEVPAPAVRPISGG